MLIGATIMASPVAGWCLDDSPWVVKIVRGSRAPRIKRHVVFDASGHAQVLTEPDRFIEIVRSVLDDLDIPR